MRPGATARKAAGHQVNRNPPLHVFPEPGPAQEREEAGGPEADGLGAVLVGVHGQQRQGIVGQRGHKVGNKPAQRKVPANLRLVHDHAALALVACDTAVHAIAARYRQGLGEGLLGCVTSHGSKGRPTHRC